MRTYILMHLVLLTFVCGCGKHLNYGEIVGHVTIDGKPVERGSVRLRPLDGQSPTYGTTIENGYFSSRAAVNAYRVEISAPAPVGEDGATNPIESESKLAMELIPARYNVNSTLTMEVVEGANTEEFALKSN